MMEDNYDYNLEDYDNIKSYGNYRQKYLKKNKNNKKKPSYHDIKSNISGAKILRVYFKNELHNLIKKDVETMSDYNPPFRTTETTYTWWDCSPCKPGVY